MVTILKKPAIQDAEPIQRPEPSSLAAWLENPVKGTEWVDDQLIEKTGMTLKHSKVQRRLSTAWSLYQTQQKLGGEVYTEAPCSTRRQGRKPDVAYLTQDLLEKYGELTVSPQSFPLCAEIVSPTDYAEDMYQKAEEYLASGGKEVWLVLPEAKRVISVTAEGEVTFRAGQVAKTQVSLPGFSIAINELIA